MGHQQCIIGGNEPRYAGMWNRGTQFNKFMLCNFTNDNNNNSNYDNNDNINNDNDYDNNNNK